MQEAIDYLGQGECDHSLVELADALTEGTSTRGIAGIRSREAPLEAKPGKPLTAEELDDRNLDFQLPGDEIEVHIANSNYQKVQ